ncbi:YfhE family protein [Caldibacillus lycopersici]|uniref:YfhE family protein n=1 Tax=Perspicuibacillus lycopersici TaxID=1325689 RepID=A0AAE3LTW9_9BACI|nr:YfhE family protein [Perspicuibacillus lycopersici]MCU9614638.1 YfhE family protein [Perspicuibacillus lycopersici]
MDRKKRDKMKNSLKKAQEVIYGRDFKRANRAGGYKE